MKSLAYDGHAEQLLEELQACGFIDATQAESEALRDFTGYVKSNRDRLDYPSARALGAPMGSGAVESAHKSVIHVAYEAARAALEHAGLCQSHEGVAIGIPSSRSRCSLRSARKRLAVGISSAPPRRSMVSERFLRDAIMAGPCPVRAWLRSSLKRYIPDVMKPVFDSPMAAYERKKPGGTGFCGRQTGHCKSHFG